MYWSHLSRRQQQAVLNASSHQQQHDIFLMRQQYKAHLWFCVLPQAARSERRRSKRLTADQVDASKPPTSTQKTILHLHRAMDMYGLTGSELFCELKRDTRCLMGWGNGTIVLAFRGTASVTNALSDLQVSSPPACLPACVSSCPPACPTVCLYVCAKLLDAVFSGWPKK